MPITLEKLFSPTVESSFPILGEVVHVTWSPWRYTGEMQELAERLGAEDRAEAEALEELREEQAEADEDRAVQIAGEISRREQVRGYRESDAIRAFLSTLIVSWDVMDGRKPFATDLVSLKRLPDQFIRIVFLSLGIENQPDPTKAPSSDEPSGTAPNRGSGRSRTGTSSSGRPATTAARRGTSMNGRSGRATTRSGAPGR